MNIKTNYDFPPIPIRNFDWSAWNDDTYDEDSIIGHGKTELDAINNLIEMIEGNVSAPINEVKEDKYIHDLEVSLINVMEQWKLCAKSELNLRNLNEESIWEEHFENNPQSSYCQAKIILKSKKLITEKTTASLVEKIKNLPQTYGEKGLGKVYDIAINDVLNLLK